MRQYCRQCHDHISADWHCTNDVTAAISVSQRHFVLDAVAQNELSEKVFVHDESFCIVLTNEKHRSVKHADGKHYVVHDDYDTFCI
jgi:hypothetical protein